MVSEIPRVSVFGAHIFLRNIHRVREKFSLALWEYLWNYRDDKPHNTNNDDYYKELVYQRDCLLLRY